jgi:hypothetical protein
MNEVTQTVVLDFINSEDLDKKEPYLPESKK